ncbi:MAG: hypothetical protein K0Q72_1724 [Armatimonadetes bacterium]|jgi:hypothetical protein|nr:hypothetical protein [Armatimonadota bacterium]
MSVSNADAYVPSTWTCGCVTGRRLCPDAVHLWRETNDAMQRSATAGDFSPYRDACLAFDAHYATQETRERSADRR